MFSGGVSPSRNDRGEVVKTPKANESRKDKVVSSVSDPLCCSADVDKQRSALTGPSLLELVPPFFPSLGPEAPGHASHFVAVFTCMHGESPLLCYLEDRVIGNGFAGQILQQIAVHNVSPSFTVKVFSKRGLSQSTVTAIISEHNVERLRGRLNEALPGGPRGDGWEDREQWKIGGMRQELLSGQLSALPVEVPHLHSSAYAKQLFAYHLPDYIRPDPPGRPDSEVPFSTFTAAESGYCRGAYPKPFVYFRDPDPAPTLLDFVTPVFPSTGVTRTFSSVISIFAGDSAGRMGLFYVELSGNEEAIDRLRAIAEANKDDDFVVKVFTKPLSRHTVRELMGAEDVEALRSLLTAALPEGPEGDGWVDRDAWTVRELTQETLPGTVAMLPVDNPPGCPYENYATQVFSLHLREFVRQENEAKGEEVQAFQDRGRQRK